MSPASFSLTTPSPDTLAVTGDLTFATAADALEKVCTELDRGSQSVLDLGGLSHVDSAGLATVLALLAHARTQGKAIKVANAPEGLQALARVSGVDEFF